MSKEKITTAMVSKKYRAGIQAFSRLLGDPTLRLNFVQEADPFFRRCALAVWKHGGPVTERHVSAYNAICSGDNAAPSILFFELCAAVEGAPEFTPPAFFYELVRSDRGNRRNCAGKFTELCSILLLLFAAVDDEVSQEEAAYVDQCTQTLVKAGGAADPGTPKTPASGLNQAGPEETQATQATQTQSETDAPEAPPVESVEDLLEELDSLCGLDQVKKDVRSLINLVKVRKLRQENGLSVPPMSLHLVFLGNPGTGKTTVARLLARLYHAIGVLSNGQLVETDRSGLVAGYVGQTAIKTQEVITKAMGGVLFIDEAYSLTSQEGANDFGKEAIEILLKNMEDHRDDLIVIVAGYTDLMEQFIHSNPGLESRFNKYFYFEDYTAQQLFEILESQCKRNSYVLSEGTKEKAQKLLEEAYENRDENFGNAREVRNLFEALIARQSDRLAAMEAPTREDLMLITEADFDAVAGETEESAEKTDDSGAAPAEDAAQDQPSGTETTSENK